MAFILSPSTLTTVLDAVNMCVTSLGESQVTAYDPSPSVDVDDALYHLNQADLALQSRGWHWNREYSFPLTLAPDGTVSIPDETLRVTNAYWPGSPSPINPDAITQRGTHLYDLTKHTNVFTVAPLVDMVVRLDWDSLPQTARMYVALDGAKRFQATKQSSEIVLQVNEQDLARALTVLEQHEDEVAGTSSVNGNANVVSALYGIGGMRRLRGGY